MTLMRGDRGFSPATKPYSCLQINTCEGNMNTSAGTAAARLRQTGNVPLSSNEWLNTAHYAVEIINPPNQAVTALLVAGIVYFPVVVSHKYVILMKPGATYSVRTELL